MLVTRVENLGALVQFHALEQIKKAVLQIMTFCVYEIMHIWHIHV